MTEEVMAQASTTDFVNLNVHDRWLTVGEAATQARCGVRRIYRAVRERQLRAARIDERGTLRLRFEWVNTWLDALAGIRTTDVTGDAVTKSDEGGCVPCLPPTYDAYQKRNASFRTLQNHD